MSEYQEQEQPDPEVEYIAMLRRNIDALEAMEKALQCKSAEPAQNGEAMARVIVAVTEDEKDHARELLAEDAERIRSGLIDGPDEPDPQCDAFEAKLRAIKARYPYLTC